MATVVLFMFAGVLIWLADECEMECQPTLALLCTIAWFLLVGAGIASCVEAVS